MIQLVNLTKNFGSFTAVKNLNLVIPTGTIFAFLGTNGAGKTTTIKMITGLLQPSSGKVEIGGYDIQKNPLQAKMLMGVIPDRPHIYNKLTAKEFLYFIADLYQVNPQTAESRIGDLLEIYELAGREHELIEGYSHGMKQRLVMCASQIHNPAVLIVDEPMVGLDPLGSKLLKNTFRKRAEQGLTIFMSTHSLSVAQELADQLAIIKNGEIIAQGTLNDLYSRAQTTHGDLEEAFLQIIGESNCVIA